MTHVKKYLFATACFCITASAILYNCVSCQCKYSIAKGIIKHEQTIILNKEEIKKIEPILEQVKIIPSTSGLIEPEVIKTGEEIRLNNLYYIYEKEYDAKFELAIEYQDYLYSLCKQYRIEQYYELLLAQMYHESHFNCSIISPTNDYGLMQINIMNHKWLSEELGCQDFLNPFDNILAGVFLMQKYLHKYQDIQKSLICYNMGESAVIEGIYSTEYSRCVLKDMEKLIKIEENKDE